MCDKSKCKLQFTSVILSTGIDKVKYSHGVVYSIFSFLFFFFFPLHQIQGSPTNVESKTRYRILVWSLFPCGKYETMQSSNQGRLSPLVSWCTNPRELLGFRVMVIIHSLKASWLEICCANSWGGGRSGKNTTTSWSNTMACRSADWSSITRENKYTRVKSWLHRGHLLDLGEEAPASENSEWDCSSANIYLQVWQDLRTKRLTSDGKYAKALTRQRNLLGTVLQALTSFRDVKGMQGCSVIVEDVCRARLSTFVANSFSNLCLLTSWCSCFFSQTVDDWLIGIRSLCIVRLSGTFRCSDSMSATSASAINSTIPLDVTIGSSAVRISTPRPQIVPLRTSKLTKGRHCSVYKNENRKKKKRGHSIILLCHLLRCKPVKVSINQSINQINSIIKISRPRS